MHAKYEVSISYRAVSALPVISKIIERHVFNSFYDYLNANRLLTEHQSGFRPKHSCEDDDELSV